MGRAEVREGTAASGGPGETTVGAAKAVADSTVRGRAYFQEIGKTRVIIMAFPLDSAMRSYFSLICSICMQTEIEISRKQESSQECTRLS